MIKKPSKKIKGRQKRQKKIIIEVLRKIPIIQIACEKAGIARATYYRWVNQSTNFSREVDKIYKEGVDMISDLAESQLLNLIKNGDKGAIIFWLKYRNKKYRQQSDLTQAGPGEYKLTKEEQKQINEIIELNFGDEEEDESDREFREKQERIKSMGDQ